MLLKGPDLTNSHFGVLTRFRQERVTVLADIEAMFHQVRVPDSDCSFLRFLWWPNGNLSCTLEEYQMTVHYSGAVLSPACSNFALRKTAEDNAQHLSLMLQVRLSRTFTLMTVLNPCHRTTKLLHMSTSYAACWSEVVFD